MRLAISRISTHKAETLGCGAFDGLRGEKQRQGDNVVRGFDPFALDSKNPWAWRGFRRTPLGNNWPWNELVDADVERPEFQGQDPRQHPQTRFGASIGRAASIPAMPYP